MYSERWNVLPYSLWKASLFKWFCRGSVGRIWSFERWENKIRLERSRLPTRCDSVANLPIIGDESGADHRRRSIKASAARGAIGDLPVMPGDLSLEAIHSNQLKFHHGGISTDAFDPPFSCIFTHRPARVEAYAGKNLRSLPRLIPFYHENHSIVLSHACNMLCESRSSSR